MYTIHISELLNEMEYISCNSTAEIQVTGVTNNSAEVQPGYAFVCIKGFKADGHKYIDDAVKRGAAVVIVTENINRNDVAVIKVDDARKALAQASCACYGHPTKKLKIIGVTGTNGKTTTTHIIKTVLDMNGVKTGMIGTNCTIIDGETIPTKRTTPESCVLQQWFAQMVEKGVEYCVMEVSSHSVELKRVYGIHFDIGIFTNLTHDHLDLHGSMENYMIAKMGMLDMSDKAIINIDDEYGRKMCKLTKCKNVLTYGIESKASYSAKNVNITEKGVIYDVAAPNDTFSLKAMLPGRFSVYNTLAAAAACHELGFNSEQIKRGIIIAKCAKGRAEIVQIPANFKVMIDYAHTPDGLYNILTTLREFAKGRIITVFGAAGDRDVTKRPDMGELAGKLSDYCIITSDNPASENPNDIILQVEKGIKTTKCPYICIENRETAILHALKTARANDIILLAGKGHETYQIVGNEYVPFSEEKIVRKYFNI